MKIDKIKKIKDNKYKIHLSNNEKITTYDDVIIKNNLLFYPNIDSDILNKIDSDTIYYDIYNKVIKFINIRLRSTKEIEKYLDKNNVLEDDKKRIIKKLMDIGLINDTKFAKAYINDKLYLSNYGPDKIRKDLIDHNVDNEIVDQEMANIDMHFIREKATKLIDKKVRLNRKYSNYQLKQKIIIDLVNLGFNKEMIVYCFDNIKFNNNDILNKQYSKIYNRLNKKYSGKELYYKLKQQLLNKGFENFEIDNLINKKVEN